MLIHGQFGRRSSPKWRPDWRIEDAPLVYLDLETTGLHPERGQQITEAAAVDEGGVRIHREASDESDERTILREVCENIDGLIVVGHNIPFDLRFITERCNRLDVRIPTVGFVDTLGLSRRFVEHDPDEKLTLEHVARTLNLKIPDHLHRALPDARLARDVFWKLVNDHQLETLKDVHLRRFRLHGD